MYCCRVCKGGHARGAGGGVNAGQRRSEQNRHTHNTAMQEPSHTCLPLFPASPPCLTFLPHFPVSLAFLTSLPHLLSSPITTCLVSLPYLLVPASPPCLTYSYLPHLLSSPPCLACFPHLPHLPASPPCLTCPPHTPAAPCTQPLISPSSCRPPLPIYLSGCNGARRVCVLALLFLQFHHIVHAFSQNGKRNNEWPL